MAFLKSFTMQVLILVLLAAAAAQGPLHISAARSSDPPQAKPGCPSKCGNVLVPFPFGIGHNCSLGPEFTISCNHSTTPPSPYLEANTSTPSSIANFSLDTGELLVMQPTMAQTCDFNRGISSLNLPPPYTISSKNTLFTLGCDTLAMYGAVERHSGDTRGGLGYCACDSSLVPLTDSCNGFGCAQTPISPGLENITVLVGKTGADTNDAAEKMEWTYPCSYAFIVEQGNFTYSLNTSIEQMKTAIQFPVVLDWAVGDKPCGAANKCKQNSQCVNRTVANRTTGYFCRCLPGYEGNPYLGCQDINECSPSSDHPPCKNGTCLNTPGSYSCECHKGFKKDGSGMCMQNDKNPLIVLLLISIGFLVLLAGSFWIYGLVKRRRFNALKQKYFDLNGGKKLLLRLASFNPSVDTVAKIFTVKEMEMATNNYHADWKIGEGGQAKVYKGVLLDNTTVAIKKSKLDVQGRSDQFINEVIVLSQISHKNVVRLLGCCLETEFPILVYEFIRNGTLDEHLRKKNGKGPLSFKLRLKIAAEVAEAIAYLHHSTTVPVIHQDVKPANILLDENFRAKVSDFGASKLTSQYQIQTYVQGTVGYLDPEYLQSSILTEKSDVYSFGVVLLELLTSKMAFSPNMPEKERNIARVFICAMEDGLLKSIIDGEVVKEEHYEAVDKVADLAKRCLSLKGVERPTMRDVARELEGLQFKPNQQEGDDDDAFDA